jgi:hypothetical protein
MATLITILDVETEVETCLQSLFAAAPFSLPALASDTATDLRTPRIDVVAEVIQWGPHQITPASGTFAGVAIYDQFRVRANLALIYQPEHAQSQGQLRGALRQVLTGWTAMKAAFAVRGYLIPTSDMLRQIAGGRTIQNDEKTETLLTTLELVVFLNPNALAAAT